MSNTPVTVTKLERPEHHGDWHDKSTRWQVRRGEEIQKFATKADATLFARLWRKHGNLRDAGIDYLAA